MAAGLGQYLDAVRDNLRLDPDDEKEVLSELETHIEDRVDELCDKGLSEEDATSACLKVLGSAKSIARQIYEARIQGTWRQAMLASMPHLLFALLFALRWWQNILWVLAALAAVLVMAIYGWWHGKPNWLFPWLGYLLLPVVAAGILLLYLPRNWAWLAVIVYIPLTLWLVYNLVVRALKRDWLHSTLMLFPIPVVVGWFASLALGDRFPGISLERLEQLAPWIGLTMVALAASVLVFIRLRQRWLKIAVLFVSATITLATVAFHAGGSLSLPVFLALILAMFGLFLTPALVERKYRQRPR